MKNPNMLYRVPGPETFEGVACETTVVDEDEVEAKIAEGWSRNWVEADQVAKDAAAQLKANEEEQARIAEQLKAAGQSADGASDLVGDEPTGGEAQGKATKQARAKAG